MADTEEITSTIKVRLIKPASSHLYNKVGTGRHYSGIFRMFFIKFSKILGHFSWFLMSCILQAVLSIWEWQHVRMSRWFFCFDPSLRLAFRGLMCDRSFCIIITNLYGLCRKSERSVTCSLSGVFLTTPVGSLSPSGSSTSPCASTSWCHCSASSEQSLSFWRLYLSICGQLS